MSHVSWFDNINYDYIALINPDPLLAWGKIGLAVSFIQAGEMTNNGELPSYDTGYLNSGVSLPDFTGSKFNPKSYSVVFGYSLDPREDLSIGLNLCLSTDYLSSAKDSNVTFDLGALYKILVNGNYLRFGAVAGNIGMPTMLGSLPFDQPMNLTAGISDLTQLFGWEFLLSGQAKFQIDSQTQYGMGAEYWLYDLFAIRAGLNIEHTIKPSFGAGVKYKNFELDYAFENYDVLGTVNRLSLLFSWGTPPATLIVSPYIISPNSDGYMDMMYFTAILREIPLISAVWINIYDEKGVKLLLKIPAKKTTDKKIEWDGKRDGTVMRDGKYKASVTADYIANGSSESNKVDIEIDNTPPEVSVEAGPVFKRDGMDEALLIPITFTFFAQDKNLIERWQLTIWSKDKKVFYSTGGRGQPPISVTWDGKGSDGSYAGTNEEYYYSFSAHDTLNNKGQTPAVKKLLLVREIKIIFSSDALFDPGMADVRVTAYQMVKEMKKIIDQYPDTKLIVSGHTDNQKLSGRIYKDNLELSKARADAVKFFMTNFMNIEDARIVTEGMADKYPIAPNDTAADRAKNRRVEILIRSTVYK
jgi:flagellar motor protein MotB